MKRYAMKGVVVRLDPATQTATIKNEKIEGWMEAMTMEFPVKEKSDWAKLAPGRQISATVFAGEEKYYIADVKVLGQAQP
jgi:protein SCO1/2